MAHLAQPTSKLKTQNPGAAQNLEVTERLKSGHLNIHHGNIRVARCRYKMTVFQAGFRIGYAVCACLEQRADNLVDAPGTCRPDLNGLQIHESDRLIGSCDIVVF